MTDKPTQKRATLVRFDSLEEMAGAEPLSEAFKSLGDDETERRAASDPDAGVIPPGFWESALSADADSAERITLRLDPHVLRHFRSTGKGFQSRINAVLKAYVRNKERAG